MSNIYGLLGEKLGHSFSPQIHSIIFNELNIDGYYNLFEVEKENLEKRFNNFIDSDVRGVNVTIPYKVEVMKYLHEISTEAEKIGAVNTIFFKDNKAVGYNTDYYGFGMMLDNFEVDVRNKKAVILGAGGAAKAIIQYLLDNEIDDIKVASRNVSKNKENFTGIKVITYEEINEINDYDIVINCTPCGMYPNISDSPICEEYVAKFKTAVDLIYNPLQTKFLKYGEKNGLKAVNGLYMLVGQAVKAEEIWNNVKVDKNIVNNIYKEILVMFSRH